jgi:preprotein translocase subunit YajC
MTSLSTLVLAMAAPPSGAGGAPSAMSPLDMILPIGLMFLIVYLLILRPQQKRAEDQRKLVSNLKKGDYVVAQAGFYGRVIEVDKKFITVEVSPNVRLKMRPDSVAGLERPDEEAAK